MNILTKGRAGGFTLVELIVVIAILGILAGIAIPVYSGYMTKANQAADNQLLAAVNTAFASACAETGLGTNDVTNAFLTIENKCITGVRPTVSDDAAARALAAKPDANGVAAVPLGARALSAADVSVRIGKAFVRYFAGNTATKLKYYEGAGNFAFENGVFVGYDNGAERVFQYSKDGTTYSFTISTDDLNAFGKSTFSQSDLTTETLMNSVETVVKDAATMFDDYRVTTQKLDDQTGGAYSQYLKEVLGMTDDQIGQMTATERANALVLLAASGANDQKAETILQAYDPESKTWNLETGNTITNMTIPYALAMAYAYSDDAEIRGNVTLQANDESAANIIANAKIAIAEAKKINQDDVTTDQLKEYFTEMYGGSDNATVEYSGRGGGRYTITLNPNNKTSTEYFASVSESMDTYSKEVALMSAITNTDGFNAYIQSEQATTDINGFLSAMSMINGNVTSGSTSGNVNTSDLLIDGFADEELVAMLQSILGN